MAKEAQRRKHAVDRRYQAAGRAKAEIEVGLPERQQVGQKIEDRLRVARYVAAVGEDLPRDLGVEMACRRAHRLACRRQDETGEGDRDAHAKPGFAVRSAGRHLFQEPDLRRRGSSGSDGRRPDPRRADDGRMREPRDDAAGQRLRFPRRPVSSPRPQILIQSPTSARPLAKASSCPAALRCRSHRKEWSSRAKSSEGGTSSNGEAPSVISTRPASGNRPA